MRWPALPLLCMAAALAAVAMPASAVGPAAVAKADRRLWTETLNSRNGFDKASRASILDCTPPRPRTPSALSSSSAAPARKFQSSGWKVQHFVSGLYPGSPLPAPVTIAQLAQVAVVSSGIGAPSSVLIQRAYSGGNGLA